LDEVRSARCRSSTGELLGKKRRLMRRTADRIPTSDASMCGDLRGREKRMQWMRRGRQRMSRDRDRLRLVGMTGEERATAAEQGQGVAGRRVRGGGKGERGC
jgi:hypothetical protein